MSNDSTPPFTSNAEYLDAWLIALRWRRLRVESEQPPPVPWKGRQGTARAVPTEEFYKKEQAAWADLRARVDAHLADPEAPTLGLELLRAEHALTEDELVILAALVSCAISETLATEALGIGASTFGMSVNSLMTLLGPEQHPHHIEDWLRWRTLFQPGSKLIKTGLMKVEHDPDGNPGELLDAYVRITNQGFRRITGAKP